MSYCENCGLTFNKKEDEMEFYCEFNMYSYDRFRRKLCLNCIKKVFEYQEDGEYFENCEDCSNEFDVIADAARYERKTDYGDYLTWAWDTHKRILCCDCALKYRE